MKKILIMIVMVLMVSACTSDKDKPSKEEKYYNEILEIETKMKSLEYFKMNKTESKEYVTCDGLNTKVLNQGSNMINYRFNNSDQTMRYISSTKVSDEIQYITQYYRGGKLYTSYSQLPYDISVEEKDEKYVYFDSAIKGVDLDFYEIKKEKTDNNTKYTIVMNKVKKYNDMYMEDYDDKSCGLIADYKKQEIVLIVNEDNYMIEEHVYLTIDYHGEESFGNKESVRSYQFYDHGVIDNLDFTIINNFESNE